MAIAFNNQNNSIGIGSTSSSGFIASISINSTGVGIGTTNPQGTLQVGTGITMYGSTGIVSAYQYYGDGSKLSGVSGTKIVAQDLTATPVYPVLANNAGVSSVGIATTGSTALVFIPSSGNLGIGTINPTTKLWVNGDVTAEKYYGDGSQLSGVSGTKIIPQDLTATPVYPVLANNAGVSSVGIATIGSTALVFVPSTGSLGVGNTNPSFALDLNGDARIRSANKLRFGGTSSTSNFYMVYNSSTNSLDFVAQ